MSPVCKRNWAESCTCEPCKRETERRRRAESEGVASVTEHEED